jgi:hypothetical protein
MAFNILFYSNSGSGAVGHIDSGSFQQTEKISDFGTGLTMITPVGSYILFYSKSGSGAVGHIDNGKFVQTEKISDFATAWKMIIPID